MSSPFLFKPIEMFPYQVRRSRSGKHIKYHKFRIPLGDIKLSFLNADGSPHEWCHGPIWSYRWIAEIPYLDPGRILSVKLPTLDYNLASPAHAEVKVYSVEGPDDIPEELKPFWLGETI